MLGWEEEDKGRREATGKREERREGRKKGRERGKGREGRRKGKREGRRRGAFCHTKPDLTNQTCSILSGSSYPLYSLEHEWPIKIALHSHDVTYTTCS